MYNSNTKNVMVVCNYTGIYTENPKKKTICSSIAIHASDLSVFRSSVERLVYADSIFVLTANRDDTFVHNKNITFN